MFDDKVLRDLATVAIELLRGEIVKQGRQSGLLAPDRFGRLAILRLEMSKGLFHSQSRFDATIGLRRLGRLIFDD